MLVSLLLTRELSPGLAFGHVKRLRAIAHGHGVGGLMSPNLLGQADIGQFVHGQRENLRIVGPGAGGGQIANHIIHLFVAGLGL